MRVQAYAQLQEDFAAFDSYFRRERLGCEMYSLNYQRGGIASREKDPVGFDKNLKNGGTRGEGRRALEARSRVGGRKGLAQQPGFFRQF